MVVNKDKNNSIPLHKSVWIAGLIVQGIAVSFLGRYLITLDIPTNIVSLLLLVGVYLAIVFPTINLIRGKTDKSGIIIALGVLNVIATVISIGFLIYVIGLYNTLTAG